MILARTRRLLATTALAMIVAVTIAACGTSTDTGTAAADISVPTAVAVPTLDADAIVAAQGEVLSRLYDELLPSVVLIRVAQQITRMPGDPGFGQPGVPQQGFAQGEGSGFVWDSQGRIVTNHHVIEGADFVRVFFADGEEYEARVLGSDPDSDLAVLEVDSIGAPRQPVRLGDSEDLSVGELAVAIGSPFGEEFTMTLGIISALGRNKSSGFGPFTNPSIIQTDTPINPGNSGGPLLDRQGRVIGITTAIVTGSQGGGNVGIGFSVPINTAKRVVPALITDGEYTYAYLGIQGDTVRLEVIEARGLPRGTRGALVADAVVDGPAHKAGFRGGDLNSEQEEVFFGGDIITAVDGTSIETFGELVAYLVENTRPGDTVTFDILRGSGEQLQLSVVLDERPRPEGPQAGG